MKYVTLSILFLYVLCVDAQYKPLQSDIALRDQYINRCKEQLKAEKDWAKTNHKNISSDISRTFEVRCNQNIARAKSGNYIFDKNTHRYFEELMDRIALANPEYDFKNIWLVLGKSATPNAYSVGDGTLVINCGIIPYLKNEGQLVFVICHEISHYLLDHSNKLIAAKFNSKEKVKLQQKLDEIEKNEYNQATQLKKLVKEYLYESRRYSRKNEYDSDSLGLYLMKNAAFTAEDAYTTMDVLEHLHEQLDSSHVNFNGIFQSVSLVNLDNGGFITEAERESELEIDSIETHPDCSARKSAMQNQTKQSGNRFTPLSKTQYFPELQGLMQYEVCEAMMAQQQYDHALLYALRKLQKDSMDLYYKSVVSYSLYTLYKFRKNHQLARFVSSPDALTETSHKNLSQYLFFGRLSSLGKAIYQYNKNQFDAQNAAERDIFILTMLAHANENKAEMTQYKNLLIEKYPESKYIREIPKTQ